MSNTNAKIDANGMTYVLDDADLAEFVSARDHDRKCKEAEIDPDGFAEAYDYVFVTPAHDGNGNAGYLCFR